ncbi:diguanylate cyclase [Magnetococcales bacterium HHB-1]
MTEQQPRPKILIVDDVKTNIKILADLLSDMSDIVFATRGEDALKKARNQPLDLILLDVLMPEMDGYQVCAALKSDPKTEGIPVLFVTALDKEDDEEKGLSLGAIDYIVKPFSPAIVRARVHNHLALRQATKALKKANKELVRLATTDPLTGAFNRRHFLELSQKEISRAVRYHTPLSVMMVDIDHFKKINDTHGHDKGDEALIETVKVSLDLLRDEDIFGRLGGEEFAILLPETPASDGGMDVAERLRLGLSGIYIPLKEGSFNFTVSIGLAEVKAYEGEAFEEALKRADQALYLAKNQGRNRTVLAD